MEYCSITFYDNDNTPHGKRGDGLTYFRREYNVNCCIVYIR